MEYDYMLQAAVSVTVLLTFAGGVVSYFFLAPLKDTLEKLTASVSKLCAALQELEKKNIRTDERVHALARRVDNIEQTINHGRWEQ